MAVELQKRIASAVTFVFAFLAGAMVAMALGINWYYIVIDQSVDSITISDLCETDVVKHKWTRSIYDSCVASSAATQLGAAITVKDCADLADRDSCAENLRMTGHAIVAFTIITFVMLVGAFAASLAGFFVPVDLVIPALLFLASFVFSVLAWAPFVAYRYGEVPSCNDRRGAPWCTAGSRKCRFYGFGFMTAVTCLVLLAFVVTLVLRRFLNRPAPQKAATALAQPAPAPAPAQ